MARSTKIKSKLIAEDSVEFSQLTAETVLVLNGDKNINSSGVTTDELDNLVGTTSPIQDQLNDESDRTTIIEDNSKILSVYAYENNAQIFADAQPGVKDPSNLIRDGWYFKNEVAGQKINWYYFDGLNQGTVTLEDLDSVYAVMTFDSIASPIIAIYTLPTGTGDVIPGFAHSRIVYDGIMTPTPVVGKKYLVYGGAEPTVHPELPRIALAEIPSQSIGERLPTEQIFTISFGSNSAAEIDQVQFMVESLGLFSAPVKHEMDLRIRVASETDLANKVSITGDTMTGVLIQSDGGGGTNTISPEGQFIAGGDLTTEYSRLGYSINWSPTGYPIQKITEGGFGYLTLNEFDSSTNSSKTIDIQLSGISMNESINGSPATPIMPTGNDSVVVKKYVDDTFVAKNGDTMTGPLNMSGLSENIQFSVYGLNASSGLEIRTDDDSTRPTGNLKLETGDASGADSAGSIYIEGGSNVDGNPGNILLTAGQSSGTGSDGVIVLDAKGVVYLNQNPNGYIDAVNHHILNVLDPVSPQDAATKKWVESISEATDILYVDSMASIFGADGSLFKPFNTIAAAIAAASNNHTIQILPGTYIEPQIIIPSTISRLTITGTANGNTNIVNGISYTAPIDSIDILIEKINIGQLSLDASSALNGLVTLKQSIVTLNRSDSNSNVFLTISECNISGGSCYGSANLSECLILANIDIYSQLLIFENSKFVSSCTAHGAANIRLLDCELFGATEFITGIIESGNTPTIQIDTASDALGALAGDFIKVLLANIPLSNLTQSSALAGQVPTWNGTEWVPSNVSSGSSTWGSITGSLASQTDLNTALTGKVSKAGDVMIGSLTMTDSPIIVDYTALQGFTSTIELGNNTVTLITEDGTEDRELNQTSSTLSLNRTNVASTTSDSIVTISVEDGAPYLIAQTTDYLNTLSTSTALNQQSISVSVNYDSTGDSANGILGAGAFAIQTTLADTSYTLIEGTSTGVTATSFDTTNVTPLMPTLPEHYTVKKYVDDLVGSGGTDTLEKFQAMKEPTGFIDRTSSVTSFNDLTREFTIAPTGVSYVVYVQATKFTKSTTETITIDNTSGNHYIYFNSAGNLSSTQVLNADLFQNNALISVIYWNTDTSTHSYFAEERHGVTLDGATHSYLHTVFGSQFISGLALQGFTVDGDGSLSTQAQFTSDEGVIRDEDLVIQILDQTQIPVLYRQGGLWRKKAADSFPMIYNGTAGYTGSRLPYNQLISGSWQLTEVANNGFVLIHIFGTNDKETPVIAIQGIAEYGNVTAARSAASTEITSLAGLPFAEFVAIGSVVMQSSDSFTNTPKASVRSVDGADYVDFRGTQLYISAGVATNHNLLSGLSSDSHLQYHTDARGDARYYTKSEVGTLINAGKSAGDITETEKSLSNFQTIPQDITGFVFSNSIVRGFSALVTVEIDADSDLFEQFTLNGIQKNGSWNMSIESIGDNTGIVFSITSSGQIQYISPAYTGFTSADIKFRAITTSF